MIQITKKSALALAVTTALWGATAVADNNDTATATVSGTVIASLAIANTTDMTLPTVVLPDNSEISTAGFSCDSTGVATATYGALGGNPYTHGTAANTGSNVASANVLGSIGNFTGTCAEFTVTGESGYHYAFTPSITTAITDAEITLADPGSNALECISGSTSTLSGSSSGTGTLGGSGDKIYCGGKITLTETATVGSFSTGVITVAVVYD